MEVQYIKNDNISFDYLNNNIPEYHLITLIIKFSGQQNCLYDTFEKLLEDFNGYFFYNEDFYKNERLTIEFVREFKKELKWEYVNKYFVQFDVDLFNFICEFEEDLDMNHIFGRLWRYGPYSIKIIRKFKDKLSYMHWVWVCKDLHYFNIYGFNDFEILSEFKYYIKWQMFSDEEFEKYKSIIPRKYILMRKYKN